MFSILTMSLSDGRDVIGLDLGTSRIKAAVVASGSRFTIKGLATAPTPAHAVENGVIANEDAVARAVAQLLNSSGQRGAVAYTAIGGANLQLRWLTMPDMPDHELQSAVRFELATIFQHDAGQMAVRVRKLETTSDGRCRVLVIAAPEQLVDAHTRVMEMAGLAPGGIDVEPLAMMRILARPDHLTRSLWRHQPVAALNIGGRASDLYVIKHGLLDFARTLSWGSDRLSQALAGHLGMALRDADRLKEDGSAQLLPDGRLLLGDREAPAEVAVNSLLGPLSRDVRRSLTYYASLHPENAYDGLVGEVILSGSGAALRGLPAYLSAELSVKATMGDPFAQPALAIPVGAFPALRRSGCGFVTALGLAVDSRHGLLGRRDGEGSGDRDGRRP